jgi:hypothetical protein
MNQRFNLTQAIQQAIEHTLGERIHTAFPAKILKYDPSTCNAQVQPAIKVLYLDGTSVELPPVVEVPVMWPRTASAIIHLPLDSGDTVLCVVCERSIDQWIKQGGVVEPGQRRKFSLTDAIAIPGLFPFSKSASTEGGKDLLIKLNNASVKISPDGTITINGGSIVLGDSALAKKLLNSTVIADFNKHVHVYPGANAGMTDGPITPVPNPAPPPAMVPGPPIVWTEAVNATIKTKAS